MISFALSKSARKVISGFYKPDGGSIEVDGKEYPVMTPADAIKAGIVLAPEDRKKDGLCTKLSIRHNLTLPNLDIVCNKLGVVNAPSVPLPSARQNLRFHLHKP